MLNLHARSASPVRVSVDRRGEAPEVHRLRGAAPGSRLLTADLWAPLRLDADRCGGVVGCSAVASWLSLRGRSHAGGIFGSSGETGVKVENICTATKAQMALRHFACGLQELSSRSRGRQGRGLRPAARPLTASVTGETTQPRPAGSGDQARGITPVLPDEPKMRGHTRTASDFKRWQPGIVSIGQWPDTVSASE